MSDWWNLEREAMWERLDQISTEVEEQFNRYRDGRTWVSIHTSAPNPDSISADSTPDKWYWSVSHTPVDIDTIHKLLSDAVGSEVSVRERPDGWEDGYWLVVENSDCI